jgi:hypothetical protein
VSQPPAAKREFTDTESDSLAQVGYLLDRLPDDETDSDWTSLENGTIRHLYDMVRRTAQPDRNTGEAKYLVWSHEHGSWWRPDRCGYTIHEERAGRYSKAEALEICKGARDGWPSRSKTPPPEIPVRESDIVALTEAGNG